jgi:hypothetical protein
MQGLIAQKDWDDTINRLAERIVDTYMFVHLAEPLRRIELRKSIILSLTIQTVECGYFIRDYTKNMDLCMLLPLCRTMILLVDSFQGK